MSCIMRAQLLRNLCDTAKLDLSTREVSELQVDLTADDVAAQITDPSSTFTTTVCVYRLNYLYLAYHLPACLIACRCHTGCIHFCHYVPYSVPCLPACLPTCLAACLPCRLPACLAACLSLPALPPVCLPVRLPARLPARRPKSQAC